MRGTTPGFWKKYERQQFGMAAACMPRTAARNVFVKRVATPMGKFVVVVPPPAARQADTRRSA